MQINSDTSEVRYTAVEGQTEFVFDFPVYLSSHLTVYEGVVGESSTLWAAMDEGTDWTMVHTDDDAKTGKVVFGTGRTAGRKILIQRVVPLTQLSEYVDGDKLPAKVFESDINLGVMIDQQHARTIRKSVRVADTSTVTDVVIVDPDPMRVLAWNAAGDGITSGPTVDEIQGMKDDAETAAGQAQASATAAAGSAAAAFQSEQNSESILYSVELAGTQAVAAIDTQEAESISAVFGAGGANVAAVNTAGDVQVARVETAGALGYDPQIVISATREMGGQAYQKLLGIPCPPVFGAKSFDYRSAANGAPSWMVATRASTAYAVNAAGLLEPVSAEVLRHDHDPVTGEYLGWLIEDTATNELLHSNDFANAVWTKTGTTVAASSITGPDGNTVFEISEGTAAGTHQIQQFVTYDATDHAWSVYLKHGDETYLDLYLISGGNYILLQNINLAAGTIGTSLVAGTGVLKGTSIQAAVDGWYRVRISGALAGIAGVTCAIRFRGPAGETSYTGVNRSFYAAFAQFEAGVFESSVIQTTTAQATRAADILAVPVADFDHNEAGWTVYIEAHTPNGGNEDQVLFDVGGTLAYGATATVLRSSNGIEAGMNSSPVNLGMVVASPDASEWHRVALTMANDDAVMSYNGQDSIGDNDCTVPSGAVYLLIGCSGWSGTFANHINGHVRQLDCFPRHLPSHVEALAL